MSVEDVFWSKASDLPEWLEKKVEVIKSDIEEYFTIMESKIDADTMAISDDMGAAESKRVEMIEKKMARLNIIPEIKWIFMKNNHISTSADRNFNNPLEIELAFKYFMEIIADINRRKNFHPTKQLFCEFLGINTSMYNQLLVNGTPDIQAVFQVIEDYLVDSIISLSETGQIKANAGLFRTKAIGQGHSIAIVSPKQNVTNNIIMPVKSKEEYLVDLKKFQAIKD